MSKPTQILFVRQRHDAKRAGLHNDYRVVIGEKAFSWASRKDFPEVGKPTILWEQPIHHAAYLNNPDITIPEGQYGAGTQVIDYAQKGNALVQNDAYHLELNNGDRFLIKKAPDTYGEKAWLFLRKKKLEDKKNPYLEKAAALGNSDMVAARAQINKKRTENGKSEIDYQDFKEQFEDRRGVSRRIVGTIGLANVGGVLGRGAPGAVLAGGVAGYFLGKSFDNRNARKNMVKEAAAKKKDDVHGFKRAGVVMGTAMGTAVASAPVSVVLAKKAFGKSESKLTEADVQSYRKAKNLRHVDRQTVHDMGAHYHPAGMAGKKRPHVAGTGPEALLHEYGHAHSSNTTRKKFGNIGSKVKWTGIGVSQHSVKGLGAIAGAYAATSDKEKVRKYAPAAVAAAATPLLVEEARATLSPVKHLYKTKGKAAAGHLLKKLAPAYGTYAVAAGAAVGATSWAKHIKNKAVAKANKAK